ncbi:ATPase/histidine kinase/DNA gyrase B/HSP90 domain protein [Marvinbryantia formatexigens DSM 14469]|uniref:ATPase/histidine kinase/DNA gyrase B/HSP90 domain protein n=1 Tax=Marvinbryantia formatexigens DSM 14469 TaxID=478749 RepID=C6LAZ7_9FIRM|nr:sensor histidine kinase [Marvinbryantia formatexigens]EET62128.1 ATPase/histidine kinase/DNA gyrase B/HSP90 domain protein [Marvinbryantia formatexigens DSM 14469]UWO26522.1 sensor histidine kinase [Marvinbryantia formatexigens DSM 14469]SDF77489.1 two-component system, sensor histidine kinase YesM [Marvinbryantia formatexigens]
MKRLVHKWTFAKRMKAFFLASIVLVSLLVLLLTTWISANNLRVNTEKLVQNQLELLATSYNGSLEQYKNTCRAILMNDSVQDFLEGDSDRVVQVENQQSAREMLTQIYNSNDNINFIALLKEDSGEYLYRGSGVSYADFEDSWEKDWQESQPGSGAMRLSYSNNYFKGSQYTVSVYYPAYSNQIVGKSYGILCINFQNIFLESLSVKKQISDTEYSELMLVDTEGNVISGQEMEEEQEISGIAAYLDGTNGSFQKDGKLVSYYKIGSWNYYLLSVTPLNKLYHTSMRTIWVVSLLLILVIFGLSAIAGRQFSRIYAPLDDIVREMARVSEGKMDVRINAEPLGKDFEPMADGFNTMMDKLEASMEEIRVKQEQLSQTRLNALQSQIQPHFLYNTLDCIHWQAVADGNREISTLVKALASYYRICLSKGKNIIPLSEELQHIEYYVLIQNMRYDNRLHLDINVDEKYRQVLLPKLTLQPLVENAVEHGIERREGVNGNIFIWVEECGNGDIVLRVANSGNGMTEARVAQMNEYLAANAADFGYGVRNVNKRIQLLFGQEYGLHYEVNAWQGVTAAITLPAEKDSGLSDGDSDAGKEAGSFGGVNV